MTTATDNSSETMADARREMATAKADALVEALPWLDRFHGETVVIKYGGHAMTDADLRAGFAQPRVAEEHQVLGEAGAQLLVGHGVPAVLDDDGLAVEPV